MDNIAHFLHYSLDKKRKIVLIYLDDQNRVVRKNASVTALSDAAAEVIIGRKKMILPRESLLGAGYARGDSGDLEKT